jgi:flagellar biosynthesis protein FliP
LTFGAFAGMAATLALVLGLLAVTLRVLRRFSLGAASGRGAVRLEVLQRISLGPRQGIAVVRVGTQTLAVSVGDGGVRPLTTLGAEDVAPAVEPAATRPDFSKLLRDGIRSAGVPLAIAVLALGTLAPTRLAGQATTTAAPNAGRQGAAPAAAQTAQPAGGRASAPPVSRPTNLARPATTAPVAGTPPVLPAPASPTAGLDALLSRGAPQMDLRVGGGKEEGGLRLSGTVGVIVMMGLLTLLPALLLLMTSFTRILIVLHFLRQAIGAQSAPPAQLVSALALLLTGFVMTPTLQELNRDALTPWLEGKIEQGAMMSEAIKPMRAFMLRQTRDRDIEAFIDMSRIEPPKHVDEVPTIVLTSAFVTSELRTAFQLGFALFLPFIVIDIVVSSVLMSMGMFMLPPAMIALPFKLLLFVLVDGWTLVIQSVVQSFK